MGWSEFLYLGFGSGLGVALNQLWLGKGKKSPDPVGTEDTSKDVDYQQQVLCENPEEEREFINLAHTSALKMVRLLDEVISVAKTEYGTDTMDIHAIGLAKLMDEVEDLTCMQAENRRVLLVLQVVREVKLAFPINELVLFKPMPLLIRVILVGRY
ncbi:hypothetical protein L2E81_01670 [Planktothrix agardhii 1033]|nr:hypothetical protein [Planktothrix agardhii 1033]